MSPDTSSRTEIGANSRVWVEKKLLFHYRNIQTCNWELSITRTFSAMVDPSVLFAHCTLQSRNNRLYVIE